MTILVIGGTGFIGPRLIRRLIDRGERVVCMDLNPGAVSPFAAMPSEATLIRGDVTRFDEVMRTVLQIKPERLINLAYGLGAGEGNPHHVMRLDVLGMDNCFEAARLGGVRRVVYASSIAVSGQQSHFVRHEPVRRAQDLQRVPGAAVHQELCDVDHRRAARQCHRPRQGPGLH
jgi:nucleoside-diphosphate-sugar epimerase